MTIANLRIFTTAGGRVFLAEHFAIVILPPVGGLENSPHRLWKT